MIVKALCQNETFFLYGGILIPQREQEKDKKIIFKFENFEISAQKPPRRNAFFSIRTSQFIKDFFDTMHIKLVLENWSLNFGQFKKKALQNGSGLTQELAHMFQTVRVYLVTKKDKKKDIYI